LVGKTGGILLRLAAYTLLSHAPVEFRTKPVFPDECRPEVFRKVKLVLTLLLGHGVWLEFI
jgi:hypothetical protein